MIRYTIVFTTWYSNGYVDKRSMASFWPSNNPRMLPAKLLPLENGLAIKNSITVKQISNLMEILIFLISR